MAENEKNKAPNKGAAANDQGANPPEEKTPTVKASDEPEYLTKEQAQEMADAAAEKAVELAMKVFMKGVEAQKASTPPTAAAPQVIHVNAAAEKKPVLPGRTEVPKEFWSDTPLTVFHSGDKFCMDGFRINGRIEPCPRSTLIMFKAHSGAEVKRFGNADQIVYTCKYTTHDKREIEFFKQDIGWGTEYWDGSGRLQLDAQFELAFIMGNKLNSLNGVPFESLKQMCKDRGLQIGTVQFMVGSIAAYDSKKEANDLAEKAAKRLRDSSAELVLQGQQVAT